jgi:hypothetical protein
MSIYVWCIYICWMLYMERSNFAVVLYMLYTYMEVQYICYLVLQANSPSHLLIIIIILTKISGKLVSVFNNYFVQNITWFVFRFQIITYLNKHISDYSDDGINNNMYIRQDIFTMLLDFPGDLSTNAICNAMMQIGITYKFTILYTTITKYVRTLNGRHRHQQLIFIVVSLIDCGDDPYASMRSSINSLFW